MISAEECGSLDSILVDIGLRPGHGALATICDADLPILIDLQEHTGATCLKLHGGQTAHGALGSSLLCFLGRAIVRFDLLHGLHARRKLGELELRVTGHIYCLLLLIVLRFPERNRSYAGRADRGCLAERLCLRAVIDSQVTRAHADREDVLLHNCNNGVLIAILIRNFLAYLRCGELDACEARLGV